MDEDRVMGGARNIAGKAEEGIGRATGNLKDQANGAIRQAQGAAQNLYGQVKDQVADTAAGATDAVASGANRMDDALRAFVEQRPYTAAAVALGIGFLIGRFGRRD
jgi:uncharacterized protein YjbJ (UPF0337 family)